MRDTYVVRVIPYGPILDKNSLRYAWP